jgi:hypothetical protein
MANEYDGIVQREIVTTRVFNAPRALVFEAWSFWSFWVFLGLSGSFWDSHRNSQID